MQPKPRWQPAMKNESAGEGEHGEVSIRWGKWSCCLRKPHIDTNKVAEIILGRCGCISYTSGAGIELLTEIQSLRIETSFIAALPQKWCRWWIQSASCVMLPLALSGRALTATLIRKEQEEKEFPAHKVTLLWQQTARWWLAFTEEIFNCVCL